MKRAGLGLLLFLSSAALLLAGPEKSAKAPVPGEQDTENADTIRERIRLYLERHGDDGRIDPERRLKAVAADYALRRVEEARRRLTPQGIGGGTWTSLGPTNGAGRATAIAPHPTAAGTVYLGTAGGGVWKTTDGGVTWTPLTEGLNDLSVGALAVAPSSPNVLYLGTGEGGYAIDFIPGIGLLTSADGGATWSLPSSVIATTFYRLVVHPSNPQELVAGTNQGGLRSTNGGATWTTVISRAVYGDVADIVRHPTDPQTLYAATWCVNSCSAGVGRVLKSTDGGTTWADKSTGLPAAGAQATSSFRFDERIALALSASNPLVLYAATGLADSSGDIVSHIYKTTDGGESWTDLPAVAGNPRTAINHYLRAQSWYNNTIVVSPASPDIVIAGGTNYVRSTDGGTTFATPPFTGGSIHVDAHDLRYQGATLFIANDGGFWSSPDDGATSSARNTGLVTRQYYALAIDPVNRNRILAGSQDNGTSQRPDTGGTAWRSVIGSDGFECGVNPLAPSFAYGTVQGAAIFRSKNAGASGTPSFTGISPLFSSPESTPFLSILTVDPNRPSTIYTGSYRVWRSDNGGDTWLPLATATTDGSAWPPTSTVTAIAIGRSDPSVLMVSKNGLAQVFRSTDGGQSWISASGGLPSARVNNLEIDPTNASVAYASIATTIGPNVYRTTNGGASWTARATGLAPFAAQAVRVDPTDPNVLYAGVDVGIYRSTDQGASWAKFGTGLPSSSVQDIRIADDGSMLRVATHGRGVWELDVPPTGNAPPSAAIASPSGPLTVARGTSVTFSGSATDPDPGDAATGVWTFSDTWETVMTAGGVSSVSHTFTRPGVYPISLAARDSHGALAAASVVVTVPEDSDDCAAAVVIPGSGPFPYGVLVNSESATAQGTDPAMPTTCVPAGTGTAVSLWFEFTPDAAGTYEISTCGTSVDTVLAVFTGPACGPYELVAGGCNDDAPAGSLCAGGVASLASVPATAGQALRIEVTGFLASEVGTFALTVRPAGLPSTTPRTTGISRQSGPSSGGTDVAVYGGGFAQGATVTFGGIAAANLTVLDPQYLTATAPAHAPGAADIAVSNPDGATGTLTRAFTYTPAAGVGPCVAGTVVLCLGKRFKVEVSWRVPAQGTSGVGMAVPVTADTGYFWFFGATNVELVIKVLDGRAFNRKFWVFYGSLSDVEYTITVTDTATGAVRTYVNVSGQLSSAADTGAFDAASGALAPEPRSKVQGPRSKVGETEAACAPGSTTLCLNAGRFQVQVSWRVPSQGTSGSGNAVPLTSDTGYLWFFNADNVELVIKVLDGRSYNNRFWVFYGALSNVEYTVTVTDTATGAVKTYFNPSGNLASVADTSAF